ncbi:Phosphate transport system permease protein PstC [Mucinivorans hirudinis]|uniref:Phosphate transport system permease protein n=1 Tax=Mucinivorans hirudinis TaxID=1433126 RepID=A0A060RAZ8_9BACT|nr:Phosphate transport system permease protein PstC [Mucinivorans hirudinis]
MPSPRIIKERVAGAMMLTFTVLAFLLVVAIGVGLVVKSMPILQEKSLGDLLLGAKWKPMRGDFGFLPFILGTLWVTFTAILWTFPVSLFTAIFLTEHSPRFTRKIVFPVLDILAGLPSVVYGVWGVLVVVPWISDWLAPNFVEYSTGYTVLAASVVLGVMILPLMISLFVEMFSTVPQELRDASLSLGATRWQTTKSVIIRKSAPGIVASVILAISRAMGETIAVLMVCGNIVQLPDSLLDGCYPLPALIANNYGEMLSVPLYESALMMAALILFVVVFVFNIVSRVILRRIENRMA